MAETKPARSYIAKAVPHPSGKGWAAQFASPGMIPDYVLQGDAPASYANEAAAEYMALSVMRDALNARPRFSSKREISQKMTAAEFAAELAETDIYPSDFAQMWGTKQERVMDWIDGVDSPPFPLRWVLPLLRLPGALDMARKITEANISYKPAWLERQNTSQRTRE